MRTAAGPNVVFRLQSGGTAPLGSSGAWTPDLKVGPLNLRSFMIHDSDPSKRMNRREFVLTSTAAGIAAAAQARPAAQAPAVSRGRVKPVVISSGNGHQFKNGGNEDLRRDGLRDDDEGQGRARRADRRRQHRRARSAGGPASATAALPNADGVVQLDSCCMHGPKKRAGGVAASRAYGRPRSWRRR